MTRRVFHAVAPISLALLLGCGGNDLSGSLSQAYDIRFTEVRARLYATCLSIEYVERGEVVPVRVTLKGSREEIHTGSFDLVTHGDVSGRLRNGTDIPRFSSGKLELDDFAPSQGRAVSGSFSARFPTARDLLSVSGSFDADLEVVDWPVAPPPPPETPSAP